MLSPAGKPKVTVVIPSTGRPEVVRAIESAMSQTIAPSTVLLLFDGETARLKSGIDSHHFPTGTALVVVPLPRVGRPGPIRNVGLALAATPLVAFLDDDDWWDPHKIESQLPYFEDRNVVAVGSNALVHGGRGGAYFDIVKPQVTFNDLLLGNGLITSSMICRTDAMRLIGGFPDSDGLRGIEDYAAWLRLAALGNISIDDRLLTHYSAPSNTSLSTEIGHLSGSSAVIRSATATLAWLQALQSVAKITLKRRALARRILELKRN